MAETEGLPPLARLLFINYREYLLNDLNVKMDRCTMASALEARSPFLDTALTEYASRLPDGYKLKGRRRKHILKAALRDLLPPEILSRRKMGFAVPLNRWFRSDVKDLVGDILLPRSARIYDYIRPSAVESVVRQHLRGNIDRSGHIWMLLTLEIWLRSQGLTGTRTLGSQSESTVPAVSRTATPRVSLTGSGNK